MTEEKKLNLNPVFLPVSSFFLATKLVLGERTSRRRSTGKGVVTCAQATCEQREEKEATAAKGLPARRSS
jgi:hypothetical protein